MVDLAFLRDGGPVPEALARSILEAVVGAGWVVALCDEIVTTNGLGIVVARTLSVHEEWKP